ncbi:membrane protein [Intrasporangium oryzae NRRL B-24470]|uniref:Membrane protein n=1 Tax=Intrasporangium oryzae NRRL B-24470 TaxID=1386089 RepID=W9GFZ5_9MICO|nr:hypothetical protein [Intrasporangium oryzae]EWT02799.1 membrane protein [Intrasporangium oryzae NRRL B-24470]
MTWLSILLIGTGLADLVRATGSRRGRMAAHAVAPAAVAVTAALSGVYAWPDVLALGLALLGCAAWIELSTRTQADGRHALRALAALALTATGLVAFSGGASTPGGPLGRWLAWADLPGTETPQPARVLLILALVLFNVASANVIVRLVLLAIGALRPDQVAAPPVPQPADRLKGGRLLGPMERLVILGLGLAGEVGAASLVIAAKGLLRFPEIQASGRNSGGSDPTRAPGLGIDDVTEYFLVGSFVSWITALASLALAR